MNGGIENGGVNLYTEENTVYFESGMDGVKNFFEVGQAAFTIGSNFKFIDCSDLEKPNQEFFVIFACSGRNLSSFKKMSVAMI